VPKPTASLSIQDDETGKKVTEGTTLYAHKGDNLSLSNLSHSNVSGNYIAQIDFQINSKNGHPGSVYTYVPKSVKAGDPGEWDFYICVRDNTSDSITSSWGNWSDNGSHQCLGTNPGGFQGYWYFYQVTVIVLPVCDFTIFYNGVGRNDNTSAVTVSFPINLSIKADKSNSAYIKDYKWQYYDIVKCGYQDFSEGARNTDVSLSITKEMKDSIRTGRINIKLTYKSNWDTSDYLTHVFTVDYSASLCTPSPTPVPSIELTEPQNGQVFLFGEQILVKAIGHNLNHTQLYVNNVSTLETQYSNNYSNYYLPPVAGNYEIYVKGRNTADQNDPNSCLVSTETVNIQVINPTPTLRPSPTPTIIPSPTPTLSPTPTMSPSPTPTATPSPTPTATPSPTPTATPSPTPFIPTPTASPAPTTRPSPTPTATPSPTPFIPTPTASPTPTMRPSPTPTATPSPTPFIPTPTLSPTPTVSPTPTLRPSPTQLITESPTPVITASPTPYIPTPSATPLVEVVASNFCITSIKDTAWRNYYFDMSSGVDTDGDGICDRFPKRTCTIIYTQLMPINENGKILLPGTDQYYPARYIKAGYKTSGKIKITGDPDGVFFKVNSIQKGVECCEWINTIRYGEFYLFDYVIPLNTDKNSKIQFSLIVIKNSIFYGNEIWKDIWMEGNNDRSVFYINGSAKDDLIPNQSN
jgi:hypothetical protein